MPFSDSLLNKWVTWKRQNILRLDLLQCGQCLKEMIQIFINCWIWCGLYCQLTFMLRWFKLEFFHLVMWNLGAPTIYRFVIQYVYVDRIDMLIIAFIPSAISVNCQPNNPSSYSFEMLWLKSFKLTFITFLFQPKKYYLNDEVRQYLNLILTQRDR